MPHVRFLVLHLRAPLRGIFEQNFNDEHKHRLKTLTTQWRETGSSKVQFMAG
jgi:hypothetical protein